METATITLKQKKNNYIIQRAHRSFPFMNLKKMMKWKWKWKWNESTLKLKINKNHRETKETKQNDP